MIFFLWQAAIIQVPKDFVTLGFLISLDKTGSSLELRCPAWWKSNQWKKFRKLGQLLQEHFWGKFH